MKTAVWAIEALRAISRPGWSARSVAFFLRNVLKITRPRGSRILSNLALAYPESNEAWRRDLRRRLYDHLGWTTAEILALQNDPAQAFSWVDEVRNVHFAEDLLPEGKGALFLSGHYGNWELLAAWYAQYLKKKDLHNFHIIVQNIRDRDVSQLLSRYRENTGINLLPKDAPLTEMIKLLKGGAHIALLADVSWMGGITLPFMGHDCTHTTGPAVLGTLASVPIIPVAIYRREPFRHTIEFFQPLPVPAEKNRRLRFEQMTRSAIEALETMIAPRPELWFWLHNRWK